MNTLFVNCERTNVSNGILAILDGKVEVIEKVGAYAHPQHEGEADGYIVVYRGTVENSEFYGAATNGDPVWKEEDESAWADLMAEYGIKL